MVAVASLELRLSFRFHRLTSAVLLAVGIRLFAQVPDLPSANGPGSPVFGISESGGQQAAGGLAQVDIATGVLHSNIAFKLPTARGAVQSSLSLEYNSSSGQREAGLGWGLTLPSIERHNDSGPPFYHDPNPGEPLDPKDEDHFTYAGHPLVPICLVGPNKQRRGRPCTAAAPGESMPSWAQGWHYFRLEADAIFARFFWSPNHLTWIVQYKDGETMELGTALDDPTGNTGPGNDFDTSLTTFVPTFRWRVVRRYDTVGPNTNVIYYRWENLSQSQQLRYLTDIYDTPAPGSRPPGKPFPFSAFAHHVHLTWVSEDDTTPEPGYMPTPMSAALVWRATPELLLSRVDVTSATQTVASPRRLVRSYALTYFKRGSFKTRFQHSLLQSVQADRSLRLLGSC